MTRWFVFGLCLNLRILCAATAADVAGELAQAPLEPEECYRVTELNFAKEDVKVYLTSGYLIFAKPVEGVRYGAVFVAAGEAADAEILLLPPTRAERMSLASFSGSPNLDQHFKSATFLFTDGTGEELLTRIQSDASRKSPDMGHAISQQWSPVLQNLAGSFETRLVADLMSADRKPGVFYMAVAGNDQKNFDIMYDPTNREQIVVGALAYRDNRTFFDTWTSFPARSFRNAASEWTAQAVLDNYRIDSTIDDSLAMKCTTRALVTVQGRQQKALLLNLSRRMRLTGATVDGAPAEIFDHESLRSNLIAGNDNRSFLVVPATPLDPGRAHELTLTHEGDVIEKAGKGVYFVVSRGTWYPRSDIGFAAYDLTFQYPDSLTLVSTGSLISDHIDGDRHTTRRKTDAPVRFAGFNLGDFQSLAVDEGGYHVDVYANRHLEAALQKKAPVPASAADQQRNPVPMFPRSRRTVLDRPSFPPPEAPAPEADPFSRAGPIAKEVVDTLSYMSAEFGPAPIHNIAITPIPGGFGQGFPGLVYLSTLAYLDPGQRPAVVHESVMQTFYSELLESHEVAHQWWGNMVMPAGYHDEWLMEALANYSALLLLEKKKGSKAVDVVLDQYRHDLLAKSDGRAMESAGPVTWGMRLMTSLSPDAWRVIVYQKGTWIMHMLRRRMGDEGFLAFLREVANRYRFSPISTEQFRALAAAHMPAKGPDRTLEGFFDSWVYGTGIPAVKLTYSWRANRLSGTLEQQGVESDFSALVPVEVQTARQRTVLWLATGSDPVTFSTALATPPSKVSVLSNNCLVTTWK